MTTYREVDEMFNRVTVELRFLRYCRMGGLTLAQTVNVVTISKALGLDIYEVATKVRDNPAYLELFDNMK